MNDPMNTRKVLQNLVFEYQNNSNDRLVSVMVKQTLALLI